MWEAKWGFLDGFGFFRAEVPEKCLFCGLLAAQSLFGALVLEHQEVDGLHHGAVRLHDNLNLDAGLAKLGF